MQCGTLPAECISYGAVVGGWVALSLTAEWLLNVWVCSNCTILQRLLPWLLSAFSREGDTLEIEVSL